ncbi:MAG: methylene-tetrahydromethanopterin dehydrogenase N-terminal domain-containing protein [Promethearchaeota archaeon]
MKVLELEPLKKKKLELVLVEPEFPITWQLFALEDKEEDGVILFPNNDRKLRLMSDGYIQAIDKLVTKNKPHIIFEEMGSRDSDAFYYDNSLVEVFKKRGLPYAPLDIDENALGYLSASIEPAIELYKGLRQEMERLKENGNKEKLVEVALNVEYLKNEIKSQENEIKYKIREAWMMMGILDAARDMDANDIKILFICNSDHFEGLVSLSDQLGISTKQILMHKSMKNNLIDDNGISEFLKNNLLEIVPIKVKTKKSAEKILYIFDTDAYVSPFDINMAYDAGFNVVIPFSGVTAENVTRLVQDAMFSRKPSAPTCFFVGGSNVAECDAIVEKVKASMFKPFEHPVVVDPRGAHTTAASIVAETVKMAMKHDWDGIKGKRVAVFGAGPVGQLAAIIAAQEGCLVTIVETWDGATEESIQDLAKKLNDLAGKPAIPIMGVYATDDKAKSAIVKEVDIIWAVATAGVQVISKELLEKAEIPKLVIDINAVPPAGVQGLKSRHEDKEFMPNVFGTGPLALGGLKYDIESNILRQASNTKGLKIFNYRIAYDIAKQVLFGKKIIVNQ